MSDYYFGYETHENTQLMENRRMAAKMGENITRYPTPESGEYIEPTPNFGKKFGDYPSGDAAQEYYANGIEQVYRRVMSQDATVLRQVGSEWVDVAEVLDELRIWVRLLARKLQDGGDGDGGNGGWSGAGADTFLSRGPGATLKSLDEWYDAAMVNHRGARALAAAIESRQGEMKDLWEQYQSAIRTASTNWFEQEAWRYAHDVGKKIEGIGDIPAGSDAANAYITWMRNGQYEWHRKAQQLQYDMAQDYWTIWNDGFRGGTATVYEGPTNAVKYDDGFLQRYMMDKLGGPPGIGAPPKIQTPGNVKPNLTNPNNITNPNLPPPEQLKNLPPDLQGPTTESQNKPDLQAPDVPSGLTDPPTTAPPNIPAPVLPPGLGGKVIGAPPAARAPALPTAPTANNLTRNMPSTSGPAVLRPGLNAQQLGQGGSLPPGLPQGAKPGQTPPAAIRGRGPTSGTPSLPPQGKHGDGDSTPATPGTPRRPGSENQFGGPPGTPSSPVLRNPRATPESPTRRRDLAGGGRGPMASNPGGTTLGGETAPPVLNRPQPRGPERPQAARPTRPEAPIGPANPMAPPPPRTSSPVVGRSPRLDPQAPRSAEPTAGVMRGKRNDGIGGYEAEIGSRKREVTPEEQRAAQDEEFEKIRQILNGEGVWKVDTPGGGVLDGAPTRPNRPSAEPKPTLGT